MKINNKYEARSLVLYNDQEETTKSISPYISRVYFKDVDIFGDTITNSEDYYSIEVNFLLISNKNPKNIQAKKRRQECFIVLEPGTLEGVLYIPFKRVLTHEITEVKKDHQNRGCVSVSHNDLITFDTSIQLYAKASRLSFVKGSDPAPSGHCDYERIDERLEKLKNSPSPFLKKDPERMARLIALYEQKLAEGFEYIVWEYRCEWKRAESILFEGHVERYEKSPEYIKLEKLTNDLKTINKHWGEDDTIQLLKKFNITKKRNGGSK